MCRAILFPVSQTFIETSEFRNRRAAGRYKLWTGPVK